MIAIVVVSSLVATIDPAELERRIDALAAEVEQVKLGEVVPTPTEGLYGLGPAASKVYGSGKGVTLGGYGELLYTNYRDRETADLIDFYRAILYVGYKFSDRLVLNTEIEIEHVNEVFLEFAYLDYLWRPELNVRAGLLLVPMGITNELHEPTTFLGALRPATERLIIPTTWRENGVGVFGNVAGFAYRAYLLNGMDASGFSAKNGIRGGRQKGSKALANDVAGVLRVDYEGIDGVLVGGSVYHGGADQRPESFDVNNTIVEAHADVQLAGFSARALYARGTVSHAAELDAMLVADGGTPVGEVMQGWYAQVGYDVMTLVTPGEVRLVPYLRVERVDMQASMPAGFTADPALDQTFVVGGVAWYPHPQIVVKGEVARTTTGADTTSEQANVVMGYVF